MKFGIGQPVQRKEDPKFLTGRGRYLADIELAWRSHAAFLYSPHAAARIRSVDTSDAASAPGVIAVLTGADYVADGMGPVGGVMPQDMGGPPGHRTFHMPLAVERRANPSPLVSNQSDLYMHRCAYENIMYQRRMTGRS